LRKNIMNTTAGPLWTQRWRDRSPRWRAATDGGFDPDRDGVDTVAETDAAAFVRRHHYAATMPATTHRYGLWELAGHSPEQRLVSVLTLGVPIATGS
jgi:hypothetical protein